MTDLNQVREAFESQWGHLLDVMSDQHQAGMLLRDSDIIFSWSPEIVEARRDRRTEAHKEVNRTPLK